MMKTPPPHTQALAIGQTVRARLDHMMGAHEEKRCNVETPRDELVHDHEPHGDLLDCRHG